MVVSILYIEKCRIRGSNKNLAFVHLLLNLIKSVVFLIAVARL